MKNFACLVALAIALGGCASVEEEAASYAASDDANCRSYGARPGTSAYYECRMSKNRDHQFNAQIAAARRQRAFEDMQVLGAEIYAESSR